MVDYGWLIIMVNPNTILSLLLLSWSWLWLVLSSVVASVVLAKAADLPLPSAGNFPSANTNPMHKTNDQPSSQLLGGQMANVYQNYESKLISMSCPKVDYFLLKRTNRYYALDISNAWSQEVLLPTELVDCEAQLYQF